MRTGPAIDSVIAAWRAELDHLQYVVDKLRIALQIKEYDPNQPRIPAHQTGAGRGIKDGNTQEIDVTKTDLSNNSTLRQGTRRIRRHESARFDCLQIY